MKQQLAFFYPLKLFVGDAPAKVVPREKTITHFNFLIFDGYNVYFDTKKEKIRIQETLADHNGERNCYFIELTEGVYTFFRTGCNDTRIEWMLLDGYQRTVISAELERGRAAYNDPAQYEIDAKKDHEERLARIKVEREQRDKEQSEQQARRAAAVEKEIQDNIIKFKSGEMIDWDIFEEICKRNNIRIPIQTLGAARKNVSSVSKTSFCVLGKSRPNGVFDAARRLMDSLS